MVQYYLYVISADEAAKQALQETEAAGLHIANAIHQFYSRPVGAKMSMPLRPEYAPTELVTHFSEQNPPKPEPIILNGQKIGAVLTQYYDGDPIGWRSIPTPIPPNHYVYAAEDTRVGLEEIETPDSLTKISGKDFVELMDEFEQDQEDDGIYLTVAFPVFVNKSNKPVNFFIIKRKPFREEDRDKFIDVAGPFNMPPGYKPPRIG